jgi:hypothetical protein
MTSFEPEKNKNCAGRKKDEGKDLDAHVNVSVDSGKILEKEAL